jgi:hypothetical protein
MTSAVARCTECGAAGEPYEYRGRVFDGLTAYRGERLCRVCRDERMDVEGVNILVVDDRPGMEPYVWNTVADREKINVALPRELRGVDGRDRPARRRTRARP